MSDEIEDEIGSVVAGLRTAMAALTKLEWSDYMGFVARDEADKPIGIALVCNNPNKAALISAFVDSLEDDDAEDGDDND